MTVEDIPSGIITQTEAIKLCHGSITVTSALCLLALRWLRTLRVRTRAFGPWLGEKLSRILQI